MVFPIKWKYNLGAGGGFMRKSTIADNTRTVILASTAAARGITATPTDINTEIKFKAPRGVSTMIVPLAENIKGISFDAGIEHARDGTITIVLRRATNTTAIVAGDEIAEIFFIQEEAIPLEYDSTLV